ncbi:hypothetical protein V493_07555, partial [Pseudogymnoascus sp. VKM F-4281 (FW-2241)]
MLTEAFGAHGTIVDVRIPTDVDTGSVKGFAYITFSSVEGAKSAMENMYGADVGGRLVRLDYAPVRPNSPQLPGGGGSGGGGGGCEDGSCGRDVASSEEEEEEEKEKEKEKEEKS